MESTSKRHHRLDLCETHEADAADPRHDIHEKRHEVRWRAREGFADSMFETSKIAASAIFDRIFGPASRVVKFAPKSARWNGMESLGTKELR